MAKKQTKKANRKRRSFFEPESKMLAKWLADQNDLGVSLQLIIVDAIRNYGDGDVLQAFLTARESVPGEPRVTASETLDGIVMPVKQAKTAPVKQTAKLPTPTVNAPVESAPVLAPVSRPDSEPEWLVPPEAATEPVAPKAVTVKPAPEPEVEWELPAEVATEPVAPVVPKAAKAETVAKPAPKAEPVVTDVAEEPTDEVDPLNIMFADAGSQFRE